MATPIINIKFLADLAQFSSQMQNANRKLEGYGKQMSAIGKNLTTSVTLPLVGIGGLAIATAAKFETLQTSLITSFDGSEAAAKSAFNSITQFAAKTPFQVEEVANAFIKLKNLGLDPSEKALTSYGNTASAMGKTLNDVVEAVADASTGEFERLKEFGIRASQQGDQVSFTFKGVTQTVAKESAAIQKYLLNIGDTDFAGGMERQSKTFAGRLSTIKDSVALLFKDFGEIIIEYLEPLVELLTKMVAYFKELSPSAKKFVVILAGVASAVGPLLALAGTILPAIATGFALLTGPIGLIIAGLTAVGVIIYKNWAPIKKTLIDIANYFIDLYNESTLFRIGVQGVINVFKNLFEVGKFVFEALKSLLKGFIDNLINGFTTFGKLFKAVLTGNFSELPKIISEAVGEGKKNFNELTTNLGKDFDALWNGIKKNGNDAIDAITKNKKVAYLKENVDATAIKDAVSEATAKGMAEGASGKGVKAEEAAPKAFDLNKLYENTDLKLTLATADAGGESFLSTFRETMDTDLLAMETELEAFTQGLAEKAERMAQIGAAIGESVGGAFESLTGRLVDSFGLASTGFEGFVKGLVSTVTKLIAMMLSQSIASSIAGATASGAATGPAAIFTTPAFIATAVGGVLAAFAAIPKFETGGIVGGGSFYGDKILARVNSGELILNKDQQKNLYGLVNNNNSEPMVLIPDVVLKGEDMILQFARATARKNRRS